MQVNWKGVLPAITTPFNSDLSIDYQLLAEHALWMVNSGCVGIVPGGSLGEAATLSYPEKLKAIETLASALDGKAPVVAGVASLSTLEAAAFVKDAAAAGASGFMVLPPYVYSSDWREMKAHLVGIMQATNLPVMLYNNPVAYKTDFSPSQMAELAAEFGHLEAVKESSADVRRVTAIKEILGDRLQILMGVDDLIVEGVQAGARGWIAGLVNAFPVESVRVYELAMQGRIAEATPLYHWFLPLLRMDTVPKFVQLIKWVQAQMGWGNPRVRPPRLEVVGPELAQAQQTLQQALQSRPTL